jgi:hypothetical protein
MLTDSFLDKRGSASPANHLCSALIEVCIPLTGRRILALRSGDATVDRADEIMIEFELCIKLIFKPFKHHAKRVADANGNVSTVWKAVLAVLEDFLRDETPSVPQSPDQQQHLMSPELARTMSELANEHLRGTIMFLVSAGILSSDPASTAELTTMTWESVGKMGFCKSHVEEWKESAKSQATNGV